MATNSYRWQCVVLFIALMARGAVVGAQQPSAATTAPATNPALGAANASTFKPEELEQIVAPIALYPDSLLAQVLMGSTYPLEIVQAERWTAENKNLKDDALASALEKVSWDPSVKSLVNFPQVLTMMSKQLDWTTKLGDAFIADQKAVMDAIQRLRAKAQAEGNLKTTPEQKVIVEQAPPPQPSSQTVVVEAAQAPPPQVIKIESASPQVVYVPTYNPTVVYGSWPYPAYPPYAPYYPPGYVASNMLSFGLGVACGAAWGYAWGGCHWGGGEVDIDVNRNTEFNRNINRESHRTNIENRSSNRTANRQGTAGQGGRNSFQHDPSHRKGVSYRDQRTASQYSRPGTADAAKARESFRGRAETGRQDIARGGVGQPGGAGGYNRGGASASQMPARGSGGGLGAAGGASSGSRVGSGAGASPTVGNRSAGAGSVNRSPSSSSRSTAFSGTDRGGSSARSASSRGASSRSSGGASYASRGGSYGGGSRSYGGGGGRSAGGGARGGGGRGGGGGGRR